MNDFIDKKWFIFVKDKHEGPFSIDEVQNKILLGSLPKETYAWKEGMSDWKVTSAVPEFHSFFVKQKAEQESSILIKTKAPAPEIGIVETHALSPNTVKEEIALIAQDQKVIKQSILENKNILESEKQPLESSPQAGIPNKLSRSLSRFIPSWKLFLIIIPITLLGISLIQIFFDNTLSEENPETKQTFVMNMVERFPFLDRWISILPNLDVSEEEYKDLKSAAKAKLEITGPKFALALSRKDLQFPEIFLASNLPEGTKFRLHIIGNTSTLLNWLAFEKETEIVLTKKLARTGMIHFQDGKPIPRGEYVISLSAGANQPQPIKNLVPVAQNTSSNLPSEIPKDVVILTFKTYFLGGPRDAVYTTRLKEFHDRLKEKANHELSELKQFSATLENQFDSTISKFAELKDGRQKTKQKNLWANFHQEWSKLEVSFNTIFDDWTPAVIHDRFFYGMLYQLIRQVGQSIDKVHSFQNSFFTSSQDPKTLQIQIGETTASAQGTLILLKSKIEQAEKIPPTVNGMPRTEGL